MKNFNPKTGIRYGVISANSLDTNVLDELFYGETAVDVTYMAAYNEAKTDAAARFDAGLEDAEIAANETDHLMCDEDREDFIFEWLLDNFGTSDKEQYVEYALEEFSDIYSGDESLITGTYEGVSYQITWLGGAPLVWVLEGPVGWVNQLCSPCVPDAGDLNGGFYTGEVGDDCVVYTSYIVPKSWLAHELVSQASE